MEEDQSYLPSQSLPRKTLILGGSGFIGTRVAGLFAAQSIPFCIGDLQRSEAFPDQWTWCDVRKRETLAELARDAHAILNLAAAHRDDVRPLSLYQETNVDGASQVCAAAREAGIQTIIFISSVAVYGFHSNPVDEDGPFAPFNEYGKTKLQAEAVYRAWADEDPARTLVILRPAAVFGEGNRGNVYNLLHEIAAGRFLMVGDGNNRKSIAYIGNVAAFLMHALTQGPGTHIFNYADAPDMNMEELVEFTYRSLGLNKTAFRIPKVAAIAFGRIFDAAARITGRTFPISAVRVRKFCENTQLLSDRVAQSGFVPPFSLREALDRTIRFEFPARTMASDAAAPAGPV